MKIKGIIILLISTMSCSTVFQSQTDKLINEYIRMERSCTEIIPPKVYSIMSNGLGLKDSNWVIHINSIQNEPFQTVNRAEIENSGLEIKKFRKFKIQEYDAILYTFKNEMMNIVLSFGNSEVNYSVLGIVDANDEELILEIEKSIMTLRAAEESCNHEFIGPNFTIDLSSTNLEFVKSDQPNEFRFATISDSVNTIYLDIIDLVSEYGKNPTLLLQSSIDYRAKAHNLKIIDQGEFPSKIGKAYFGHLSRGTIQIYDIILKLENRITSFGLQYHNQNQINKEAILNAITNLSPK